MFIKTLKQLKKFLIGLIGGTIILIGVVMIVLPGPAIIIIPLGFSILATEFLWAKQVSGKLKAKIQKVKNSFKEFRLTSER